VALFIEIVTAGVYGTSTEREFRANISPLRVPLAFSVVEIFSSQVGGTLRSLNTWDVPPGGGVLRRSFTGAILHAHEKR
jgi:hypothetical protein